jgi:cobyrinic acid a,c-diamide synthase
MVARAVIAGTASGVGKTTLTVGLATALRSRGLRVAMFKCGPDYLDPGYHARAAGAACHNLDGWMMGKDAVLATFAHAARGANVALIEGVMGLFDGASPVSDDGSTAQIAKWLDAPVLLACDASGMARSLAALAQGFAGFDPDLRLAGVICNRIGSDAHLQLLRRALRQPPVLGGLTVHPELAFPERHLGLRTAEPGALPDALFDAWGEQVEAGVNVQAVLELARSAPALPIAADDSAPAPAERCRIGVAIDEAFHFYYEDNLRRLTQLGARIVPFSPIHDERLPAVDGLYIGGGYPELHAHALYANSAMRADIARFAARGGPIYAECGGLMYLATAIDTIDGATHAMTGIVPARVRMHDRLQALGYVEVETRAASVLGGPGLRFRGHQFRYSELELHGAIATAYSVRKRRGGESFAEGYLQGNVLASYVHAHWASNPLVAEGFVDTCAARAGARP